MGSLQFYTHFLLVHLFLIFFSFKFIMFVGLKRIFFEIYNHLKDYPVACNLNYFWSFGSLAGIFLIIQILTGLFLSMHYIANADFAFLSVEHIMRDVNYGWLLRYCHSNGASFFFIALYLHIGRNLFYRSYLFPRVMVWFSGIVLFFLTIITAFTGYVLPWGQMSFWGTTVITNFVTILPYIGTNVVTWLWGGFCVSTVTLNRFFSIHFILPFIILALSVVHILLLHFVGSSNPLGVEQSSEQISFFTYFFYKDLLLLLIVLIVFFSIIFFTPNLLGHPDNYIVANPRVTPKHIVPEWYFLPFYAILRSCPDKLGGVISMLSAILILGILPFIDFTLVRSSKFNPYSSGLLWFFMFNFFFLIYLGGQTVEYIYLMFSKICTILYFSFFLIFIPFLGYIDLYKFYQYNNKCHN